MMFRSKYFVAVFIYTVSMCPSSIMAQHISDVEVQDAELDCREKGGGVIFPIAGRSECVLSYQPKATNVNPSPKWKIHPYYIENYFVGFGGSAYYAEAIINGGFDLYGQSVNIHRLLQDGKALRNYFTLGNGDLQIQHVSNAGTDKNQNGVVYYALIPNKNIRQDTEWGFDHTLAISKFDTTEKTIADTELLDLIKERCTKTEGTRFDQFIRYDKLACQRYLSIEEMSAYEQRDQYIADRLQSDEFFETGETEDKLEDYLDVDIINAKIRCPVSKVSAVSAIVGELEGKAKCYLNFSKYSPKYQKNIWHIFPYFVDFYYKGSGSFMVGAEAKGELEGEFGFLNSDSPIKLKDLFGISDKAITNGFWVHHGSHTIRSKKGRILLDLHSKKFGSSHLGKGISWDTPAKTKMKQSERLLSQKYAPVDQNGINEYQKIFNTYLAIAKRDCRLLALARNEMSASYCSKSKILEPQGRLALKSLKEDFNFYSFSHNAGSIPLPEKFDYSQLPEVNYFKKLLDLTFGKNYRRWKGRTN